MRTEEGWRFKEPQVCPSISSARASNASPSAELRRSMIPTGPLRGEGARHERTRARAVLRMILADHGADVIEVLRPASGAGDPDPAGFVLAWQAVDRGRAFAAEGGAE